MLSAREEVSSTFLSDFLNHYVPKKDIDYQRIYNVVREKGLIELSKDAALLAIGETVFLESEDFLYLALIDRDVRHYLMHLSEDALTQLASALEEKPPTTDLFCPPKVTHHPEVKEGNGVGMEYVPNEPFESWEGTIINMPETTFIPKTIQGLQNLVLWAKENNKRVRATGYRHSSSPMYSEDEQVLISMLDLKTALKLPAEYPKMDPQSELQNITLVGEPYEKNGQRKIKCKIGGSTANYHFQEWVHDPERGNLQWAMPLNVIMTEITFAGSNAMMCHGAGIHNQTLSDLVSEIEFVNVKGERQVVNDPEQIKAAAGCFGMLGIVTSITLELDEMTFANFANVGKEQLALTIPPPESFTISNQLKKNLSHANLQALTDKDAQKAAFQDFIDRAENSYYAEWFWFPLQDKCWINCWQNNGEKAVSSRYPNKFDTDMQRKASYLAHLGTLAIGDYIPPIRRLQTRIMSDLTMAILPDREKIVCSLEDAIHFRKGIQNFRTRMMEIEVPIPDKSGSTEADWSVCQQAWWDVIEVIYSEENLTYFPMRTTLEMRLIGGSDMLMASQHGNKRTCAIEVLTPLAVNCQHWERFMQQVLDKWAALKDDQGRFLNIRPHWAKRFDNLVINRDRSWINQWDEDQKKALKSYTQNATATISLPMRVYLKEIAYKTQFTKFMQQMDNICRAGGYTLKDIRERFFNPLLDDLTGGFFHRNEAQSKATSVVSSRNQVHGFFKPKEKDKQERQTRKICHLFRWPR